jgi:hypothetical protein
MVEVDEPVIVEHPPLISWGAIFAGIFFVITASWLLFLLGSAIGVGIADASDLEAVGKGFGFGAAAWLVITTVLVYFLGSWLAARLAGIPDKRYGRFHGLVLWSAVGVLILILGSLGVSNVMQAGQSLISGTASVAGSVVQGAQNAASSPAAAEAADSPVVRDIQAMIKRQATQVVAEAGENASAEAGGGTPQVTQDELQQAVQNMDAQTLTQVAQELVTGDTEGAKNVVTVNTNLSEQEVNSLIDGISQAVNERVQQAKQEISDAVEKASSYTQAVMWALVVSSLLGLAGALFGGTIGARTNLRIIE